MQDTDKFDLEIRSMLTDAEEPVPASAWEAVSGALDRKARRAAILPVWRWTALSLAAAAAIAVGIFLFTPAPSLETVSDAPMLAEAGVSDSALIDSPDLTTVSESSEEQTVWSPQGSASQSAAPAPPTPACVIGDADNLSEAGPSPYTRPGVDRPSATTPSTPNSELSEETDKEIETEIVDDTKEAVKQDAEKENESSTFDMLNPEADLVKVVPQKERGRLAFVAGGNMESNASPSRSRFSGRRVSAMPKKGVTEQGDNSSYGIPLTLGVGLKWHFTPHWALGTGLNYSYLSRSFTGTYFDGTTVPVTAEIDNGIHYVGLPLNLYYQFSDTRPVQFYAFTGLTLEKGLQNRFRIKAASGDILYHENIDGVQLSFALGIGVGFRLTDHISLYLDPSLRYYLENGQPKSIRTAQPLMMSIEAGLRFDL